MKDFNVTTKIMVCSFDELSDDEKNLILAAKRATQNSYSPYSNFKVGAAVLLSNGEILSGSNQENAAYPSGLCAERTTIFYANSLHPDSPITTLAIAAHTRGGFTPTPAAPCGACRQVILESETRYKQPIRILLYGDNEIYMAESIRALLPLCFTSDDL